MRARPRHQQICSKDPGQRSVGRSVPSTATTKAHANMCSARKYNVLHVLHVIHILHNYYDFLFFNSILAQALAPRDSHRLFHSRCAWRVVGEQPVRSRGRVGDARGRSCRLTGAQAGSCTVLKSRKCRPRRCQLCGGCAPRALPEHAEPVF